MRRVFSTYETGYNTTVLHYYQFQINFNSTDILYYVRAILNNFHERVAVCGCVRRVGGRCAGTSIHPSCEQISFGKIMVARKIHQQSDPGRAFGEIMRHAERC